MRELIGYVPQEPVLFTGTIKENILMPVDEISEEEYQIAVKTAQLEQELASSQIRMKLWLDSEDWVYQVGKSNA